MTIFSGDNGIFVMLTNIATLINVITGGESVSNILFSALVTKIPPWDFNSLLKIRKIN